MVSIPLPILSISLLLFLSSIYPSLADEESHIYSLGEDVVLWVNKIGPYYNPQESYDYYSLPFCKPSPPLARSRQHHTHDGLGSLLEGNDLQDTLLPLRFRQDIPPTEYCTLSLTHDTLSRFSAAIEQQYWYQLYVDDLPIWGLVGEPRDPSDDSTNGAINSPIEDNEMMLFTHMIITIAYNGNQIVRVDLSTSGRVSLKKQSPEMSEKRMSFEVLWVPSELAFEDRFGRYLDTNFFEHDIHWFALFNSFMMVVFLLGLVFLVLLRTLRSELSAYSRLHDDDDTAIDLDLDLERLVDDSGWKQVHGDVFRRPSHLGLLSAFVGVGLQLFILGVGVLTIALLGSLYVLRGALLSATLLAYALTTFVAGWGSGSLYKIHSGRNWKSVLLTTLFIVPVSVLTGMGLIRLTGGLTGGSGEIAWGSMVQVSALWAVMALPLGFVGTVVGRAKTQRGDFPCRVSSLPRPIPRGRFFLAQPALLAMVGGLLPFGSIFIEMYFVFTSFWNYKFYYVYGLLLLVLLLLGAVVCCVAVVSTYVLLNAEDYRWQWTSFFSGASTSVYVMLYAVYYFYCKTQMVGLFQTVAYFCYSGLLAGGVALVCGALSFTAARMFVRRIYCDIKSD